MPGVSGGVAALVLSCVLVTDAGAVVFGGGGHASTDCLVVFDADVNYPTTRPRKYRCVDGDLCDADGLVNGQCAIDVAVCANSTYNAARCTLNGVESIVVDHALDNGDPRFDPQMQALQNVVDGLLDDPPNVQPDACVAATRFIVPVIGPLAGNVCRRGRKTIRLVGRSTFVAGVARKDTDRLKLECDPAPAGCNPSVFFAGTFDRIQKQIFNQSCALSFCHDSQTKQKDLLLEVGAAYTNIVDVVPTTDAAATLGWKRIDATGANPATSYLYRKITGDLPDPLLGARMPFGRPALDPVLVDVVRRWIEAGAPATGWVPGTF